MRIYDINGTKYEVYDVVDSDGNLFHAWFIV